MARRAKAASAALIVGAVLLTSLGVGGIAMSASAAPDSHGASTPAAMSHMGHAMAASTEASAEDPDGDGYIPAVPPVTGVEPSTNEPPHALLPRVPGELLGDPHQAGRPHRLPRSARQVPRPHLHGQHDDRRQQHHRLTGRGHHLVHGARRQVRRTGCRRCTTEPVRCSPSARRPSTTRPASRTTPACVRSPRVFGSSSAARCRARTSSVTIPVSWRAGSAATATSTSTSPRTAPNGPTSSSTSASRRPVAGTAGTWTRPTTRATWRTRVVNPGTNNNICPADHPVALPMIEFKMAFPVNGDMSQVELASGPGYSLPLRLLQRLGRTDAQGPGGPLRRRWPPVRRPRLRPDPPRGGRGARRELPTSLSGTGAAVPACLPTHLPHAASRCGSARDGPACHAARPGVTRPFADDGSAVRSAPGRRRVPSVRAGGPIGRCFPPPTLHGDVTCPDRTYVDAAWRRPSSQACWRRVLWRCPASRPVLRAAWSRSPAHRATGS